MSYEFPLTVKLTSIERFLRYGEKTGDLCKTLMSLHPPGMPKYACQIQRSWVATTSRIIVGYLPQLVNWPFQAVGQFHQTQCNQSIIPNIPSHPHCSLKARMRAMLPLVGAQRYCSPNTLMMAAQKWLRVSWAVDSHIRTYSSTASVGTPYARMQMAATHFWRGDNPAPLAASYLKWK
jgi:hypothetical protein